MLEQSLKLINGSTLKNRIMLAPLTNQQSAEDGALSDDEFHWLSRRVAGGFGLIATCAAHVTEDGKGFPGQFGVYDDKLLPGMSRLARRLGEEECVGVVQLYHGGIRCPRELTGVQPQGPSAIKQPDAETSRAMREDEIETMIDAFADAAERCQRAGFQGVEIHGAHSYLHCAFLSRSLNQRADQWGGPLENRYRFLQQTYQRIRERTSSDFIVGVRLSPEGWGLDYQEILQVARWLWEEQIDFLHVSLWDFRARPRKHQDNKRTMLEDFVADKPKGMALVASGDINVPFDAEEALSIGADLVALGRVAIGNPDWPNKTIADKHYLPDKPPFTCKQLEDAAVGPAFIEYLKSWQGFVVDK